MIRSAAEVSGGFELRAQVCVIGSGAGGAVAAALLAEAGHEVVVLEEGAHVPKERMTQREEEMYPLLYRDQAQQVTRDGAINVLQGRVLGGSTVVNMADCVPVEDAVLEHWRRDFGCDRFSASEVRAAALVVEDAIGANRIQRHNRNNALLIEGGERIGARGRAFRHNRVGCVGSGYCLVGCAYDAKKSAALTWLPRASAAGALLQTEARVERLEHDGHRVTAASGRLVEPVTGRPGASFTVRAERFVLAAGAIHSPLLLLASKLGGREVGRNLSLQPQAPVAALFADPVVQWRGVPQSAWLDGHGTATAEGGLAGFWLEGVAGQPGQAASSVAAPLGEVHEMMRRYADVAALLCLVPDRPGGRVKRRRNGRPAITYAFQDLWRQHLREGLRTAARAYLAAGAEAVLLPLAGATPVRSEDELGQLDALPIRANAGPVISAHPQGTCRMGPSAGSSVVDLDLKLHGCDNLWVMDASVFPTTSSTHTMVPVMSFAWLAARALT